MGEHTRACWRAGGVRFQLTEHGTLDGVVLRREGWVFGPCAVAHRAPAWRRPRHPDLSTLSVRVAVSLSRLPISLQHPPVQSEPGRAEGEGVAEPSHQ